MFKTRHLEVIFQDPTKPAANFVVNPRSRARLTNQSLVKFHIEKQVSSEPNSAILSIYGLDYKHSSALDFVFDLFAAKFGAQCIISGGFLETKINQLYSGVITNAITVREGAESITKISIRNNYIELMRKPVELKVFEGQTSKATALLSIIKNVGGQVSKEQETEINDRLGREYYAEDEIIKGQLSQVLAMFNRTLHPKIAIYWDSAGTNFTPPGAYAKGRKTKVFSEKNGLIGNPVPTSSGMNFSVELDGSLRISDPVELKTDVFNRLISSQLLSHDIGSSGLSNAVRKKAFDRIGTTSLYKIIHTGDNRTGEFKTICESKYLNTLRQAGL